MHDTAYRIGGLVMDTYLPTTPAKILEIGAQNVNGTLRDHAPRNAEYTGIDFEAGNGVDIVITGLHDWNVPDAHFDMVMASSVFEHDKAFWRTFLVMCAKTKPGGHIYVSAPSNGTVHRYPQDYWRFYPDAGLALEEWSRNEGCDVTLVESFIAERKADVWNDFCAVFRRGPSDADLNRDFVFERVEAVNALTWRSSQIINPTDDSEDTRLLAAAHEEKRKWVLHSQHLIGTHKNEIAHHIQEIARLNEEIGRHQESLVSLDQKVAMKDRELITLRQHSEDLTRELDQLNLQAQDYEEYLREKGNANSELQSRLAQRQEEAVQAWATAQKRLEERDLLAVEMEKVRKELADANQWVSKLALNRTQSERQIVRLERALDVHSREFVRLQRRNAVLSDNNNALQQRHDALIEECKDTKEQAHALRDHVIVLERHNSNMHTMLSDNNSALQNRYDALVEEYKAAEEQAHILSDQVNILERHNVNLQSGIDKLHASGAQVPSPSAGLAETRLKESREEIAALSRMVAREQDNAVELERRNVWLQATGSFLLEPGKWWWRFMPLGWQRRKRDKRLLRRNLFDSDAYLARHLDVAASEQDPLLHFILHGIAENRRFD